MEKRIKDKLKKAKIVAIDTETTGVSFNDKLVGVSVAISPNEGFYFTAKENLNELFSILNPKLKIFHHFVFDYLQLKKIGIEVSGEYEDTKIMAYLLDPEQNNSLGSLGIKYKCKNKKQDIKELLGKGKNKITFDKVDIKRAASYSITDAKLTYELYTILQKEISKNKKLFQWYKAIELPLAKLLAEMIFTGIKIDVNKIKKLSERIGKECDKLEKKIYYYAKEQININSPKQLSILLFKKLGLKPLATTKTGSFSTDIETLEELKGQHPIVDALLEYRKLFKLKSTYLDALPKKVDSKHRLHTFFHQTNTASGRLASSDPNLQNIPKKGDLGKEIRSYFIAKDGYKFIIADYSQIELRVAAFLSGESKMYNAFKNGTDIHQQTAQEFFKNLPDARDRAKTINFGILYGMGVKALSKQLNCSLSQAGKILKKYFRVYPRLGDYKNEVVQEGLYNGYVSTIGGRIRYIPQLKSLNEAEKSFGERIAMNTPVQGSAADIIKVAMLQVDKGLKENKIDGQILLQIHDELIIEVNEKDIEKTKEIVNKAMTKFYLFPISKKLEDIIEINLFVNKAWDKK